MSLAPTLTHMGSYLDVVLVVLPVRNSSDLTYRDYQRSLATASATSDSCQMFLK